MAYDPKYFTTSNTKVSEGQFTMAAYDAAAVGDDTADITVATGAGYFPHTVCPAFVDGTQLVGANPEPPTPMTVVAVKTKNNTAGDQPAVGLFAVNVVLTSTSTGSGASTVTTYTRAKHTDGRIKTRCQLMTAGQIVADNTDD